MDNDLKCNRLTCRKPLTDKAVVTTCSHIFCVECANELFNASRLCPACETSLTEPDDVVVCSLHPSNDYKTSVLSGLAPSIILEICSRAIAFWQYQIHQENSFQHAVVRNLNDKNAQLQKQLDNVVREANSEIQLLTSKGSELERDLELERRKVRELQENSRERDKEYQKLKVQFDKVKRKALLGGGGAETFNQTSDHENSLNNNNNINIMNTNRLKPFSVNNSHTSVDIGAVVGGMEANGIQRTPIVSRTASMFGNGGTWSKQHPQQNARPMQLRNSRPAARRKVNTGNGEWAYTSASERSDSATEVENMLGGGGGSGGARSNGSGGWMPQNRQRAQAGHQFLPPKRGSGGFRPALQTQLPVSR